MLSCTKLHERQPAKSGDNYRDWRYYRSDDDTGAKKERGKGVELFANVRYARLGTQRWRFTNILLPFEEQSYLKSVLSCRFTGWAKDCGRWLHTVHFISHQSQFLQFWIDDWEHLHHMSTCNIKLKVTSISNNFLKLQVGMFYWSFCLIFQLLFRIRTDRIRTSQLRIVNIFGVIHIAQTTTVFCPPPGLFLISYSEQSIVVQTNINCFQPALVRLYNYQVLFFLIFGFRVPPPWTVYVRKTVKASHPLSTSKTGHNYLM